MAEKTPQNPIFVCACLGSHHLGEEVLHWLVTVIQVLKWTVENGLFIKNLAHLNYCRNVKAN